MDAKEREKDSHRTDSERMEAERVRAKKNQKERAKAEKFKNATEEEAFKPINGTVRDVQTKVAKIITRKFETDFIPLFRGEFEHEKGPGELI